MKTYGLSKDVQHKGFKVEKKNLPKIPLSTIISIIQKKKEKRKEYGTTVSA